MTAERTNGLTPEQAENVPRDARRFRLLVTLIRWPTIDTGGIVEAIVSGRWQRVIAILDDPQTVIRARK